MNLINVIFIAIGLAMDAFAVSIASGASCRRPPLGTALATALAFGGFQAGMPLAGWAAGTGLKALITGYDHWVAFVILASIGIKMILESFQIRKVGRKTRNNGLFTLFALAIATSIDAFAVGVTLTFLVAGSLLAAVAVIGLVTFGFSFAGVYIGKKAGHFFETGIEAAGGIILLAIGTRILFAHL